AAAEDADGVELLVLLIVRLVDRDDDRAAVVREAPQRADDVRRVGPAQARRRLVEDEQRRVRDELDGEVHAPALSTREHLLLGAADPEVALIPEADLLERGVDRLLDVLARGAGGQAQLARVP